MRDLPTPRVAPRTAILRSASQLFRRHGHRGTGVSEVFSAASVPKGSLYYHFPGGKTEIVVAAVQRSGRAVNRAIEHAFHETDLPGALTDIAEVLAANLEQSGFLDGCPLATVALEEAAADDRIGDICRAVLDDWLARLNAALRASGLTRSDAQDQAMLILAAFEGALLVARIHRDTTALHRVAILLAQQLPDIATSAQR